MRLHTVPARRGLAWMRDGFAIFGRFPLGFSGLFAAFLFAVFALSLLPFIGAALLLTALPLVTLAFMLATRQALAGRTPGPQQLFTPLRGGRARLAPLLQLGVVYTVATFAVAALSGWLDGGALDTAMEQIGSGDADPDAMAEKLGDSGVEFALLLRLGMAALLSIPFWHAPALVHWGGQGSAQALFSSTLAVWRNRGAFTVYGLAWAAAVLAFGLAVSLFFGMIGQPKLIVITLMPASLLFSTAFYASLWFTFADCFGDAGDDNPSTHAITSDTP